MLTLTGLPTADILDYVLSGIKIAISTIEMSALLYLISGGWLDIIRIIGFFLDSLFVQFIGTFFNYFTMIVEGTIFTPETISEITNRLYVFIGIIVFFKLSFVIIRYIMNPELVSDAKAGVNSLVKRVIFGFALIIFMPTIFSIATDLQTAIIKDKVIEKIILSEEDYLKSISQKEKTGYMIGTNILQGFWSLNSSAWPAAQRLYKNAINNYDPSAVGWTNINSGKVLGMGEYNFNYFPVVSTIVLGYVLYLIVKFCIDVALRGFKLGFLQIMAPIAIVDYITGGSEDGAFKNWVKSIKGTYLMLFVRILSLWFVVFVTTLMQKEGDESLLYIPTSGEPDYLLRAVIIIALLAFMMELPKLLSEIFGLDLEGDATVKGLMKTVAGGVKAVAGAGLAVGGAAVGGFLGSAKGVATGIAHKDHREVLGALGGNAGGLLKAGLGQTRLGGSLVNGMSSGYGATTKAASEGHSKTKQDKIKEQEAMERQEDIEYNKKMALRSMAQSQITNNPNANKSDIIESMINTQINTKLNGSNIGTLTADINGRMRTLSNDGTQINPKDVVQHVQQVLSSKLDVRPNDTTQIVNRVLGNSGTATVSQIDQIVKQVVQVSKDNIRPEITQVVNQVMGNVVSTTAPQVTQVVDQQINSDVQRSETVTQGVNFQHEEPEKLIDNNPKSNITKDDMTSVLKKIADDQFNSHQDG